MQPNKKQSNRLITSLKSVFFEESDYKTDFYNSFTKKYNLEFFKNRYDQKRAILFSFNELKFNNFTEFSTTSKQFINTYGKPKFVKTCEYNPKVKSLVYKTKIAGVGCRCILIFHKDKLVIFNYVFTKLNRKEKKEVLRYSIEKYGYKLSSSTYQVIDNNNNSLRIEDTKDSIIFNFYASSKVLKKTFDCKPKEKRVIHINEIKQLKKSIN